MSVDANSIINPPPLAPPGIRPSPTVHEGQDVLQSEYVTHEFGLWSGPRVLPSHEVRTVDRDVDPDTLERMAFDPKIHKAKRIRINGVLTDDLIFAPGATEDEAKSAAEYKRFEMVMQFAERMVAGLETPIWRVFEQLLDGGYEQGHKIAEVIWELRMDRPTKSLQTETHKRGARPASAVSNLTRRLWRLAGRGPQAAEQAQDPPSESTPQTSILTRPKTRLMPKAIKVKPRGAVLFVVDRFMSVLGLIPAWGRGVSNWNITDVISRDKFMVFTNNPTDDDIRGNSAYRPAFWAWSFKNFIPKEYLRFMLNEAVPVPVLILPEKGGSWIPKRNPDTGEYELDPVSGQPVFIPLYLAASNTVADVRSGKGGVIPYGSKLEAYGGNKGGSNDTVFPNAIRSADDQIEDSILNQTLAQSTGRSNSQKGSQTHENRLADLVFWDKRALCVMLLYDLIAVGVRWNLGDEYLRYMPKCSLGDSEKRDWARDLEVISKAYFYGFIDDSMRAELCSWLGLPRPGISRAEMMLAQPGKDGAPAPPNDARPDKQPDQQGRNDGNSTPKQPQKGMGLTREQLADFDARMEQHMSVLYERVRDAEITEQGYSALGDYRRGRKSFVEYSA